MCLTCTDAQSKAKPLPLPQPWQRWRLPVMSRSHTQGQADCQIWVQQEEVSVLADWGGLSEVLFQSALWHTIGLTPQDSWKIW